MCHTYNIAHFNSIVNKKQNAIDCHLNRSVLLEEPNGLDATSQTIICLIFQKLLFRCSRILHSY